MVFFEIIIFHNIIIGPPSVVTVGDLKSSELVFYSLNVNCIYACASCGMLHRIICINTHVCVCVCVYRHTHIRGAIERSLKVFKLISTELVTSLSSARAQTCKLELSSR